MNLQPSDPKFATTVSPSLGKIHSIVNSRPFQYFFTQAVEPVTPEFHRDRPDLNRSRRSNPFQGNGRDAGFCMRAMVLTKPGQALNLVEMPVPSPGPRQLLIRVSACAICRTDLHIIDGELTNPKLPLVPGHEVVGVLPFEGSESCPTPGP